MLQHEKMDLMKRLEEDQEDLNELMKKHKALIAQVLIETCHFTLSSLDVETHHSSSNQISVSGAVLQ